MKASLRGYQAFGAKFALVQRRAILGDEMGLGKTIQALAAMCHLAAGDARHFLVVCPASVIVNWTREIQQHTELKAYRLHGPEMQRNSREWTHRGGVAVTTYEVLRSMPASERVSLGMLTVDEAHYTKNPEALRTKAVRNWAQRTERSCSSPGRRWRTGSRSSARLSLMSGRTLPPASTWWKGYWAGPASAGRWHRSTCGATRTTC